MRKVGAKVFAIGGWEKANKPAFTFKTFELNYYFLRGQPGYRPAAYLAARGMKWMRQFDVDATEDDELRYYLQESYPVVSLGLTKKEAKRTWSQPGLMMVVDSSINKSPISIRCLRLRSRRQRRSLHS